MPVLLSQTAQILDPTSDCAHGVGIYFLREVSGMSTPVANNPIFEMVGAIIKVNETNHHTSINSLTYKLAS